MLTLEDAQFLVNVLSESLNIKPPLVVTECPECGNGRVLGCFSTLKPWKICVRDLSPETVIHEWGHWYYYWYIAPIFGRYDEEESERLAKNLEKLARDVSFKCKTCGISVLKKSKLTRCSSCGTLYSIEEPSIFEKAFLFGILGVANAVFWLFVTNLVTNPDAIRQIKKIPLSLPSGANLILFDLLTSTTTFLSYDILKKLLGWA